MGAVREGGSVSEAAAAVSPVAPTTPASPRTVLVGQLAAGLAAAVEAGDLETARVAHEAIGRLLGIANAVPATPVVELAAERARRR